MQKKNRERQSKSCREFDERAPRGEGAKDPRANLLDHALHVRRERVDRRAELLQLVLLVVLHRAARTGMGVPHASVALRLRAMHACPDKVDVAGDICRVTFARVRREAESVVVATR